MFSNTNGYLVLPRTKTPVVASCSCHQCREPSPSWRWGKSSMDMPMALRIIWDYVELSPEAISSLHSPQKVVPRASTDASHVWSVHVPSLKDLKDLNSNQEVLRALVSSEGALVAVPPYDYPQQRRQPLFEHTPVLDNNFSINAI